MCGVSLMCLGLTHLSDQRPERVAGPRFLLGSLLTLQLLFVTPGLWFLCPVNYPAENWELLGMRVPIRWPRDTRLLSWQLCGVRSQRGKLEIAGPDAAFPVLFGEFWGARAAGGCVVKIPDPAFSWLKMRSFRFQQQCTFLHLSVVGFDCLPCITVIAPAKARFSKKVRVRRGFWANPERTGFPVVILEDLETMPGASARMGKFWQLVEHMGRDGL